MKKRLSTSLLISSIIVISVICLFSCNSATPIEEFVFELNEDGQSYAIVGYTGKRGSITLPEEYNGLPVTELHSIDRVRFDPEISAYSVSEIKISKTITYIAPDFYNGDSNLKKLKVDKDNSTYYDINNCIIERETKTLIRASKEFTFPTDGSVTKIGDYAFSNIGTTEFAIPEGVTSIGNYAFYSCMDLKKVSIPSTIEYIGEYAFLLCDKLTYNTYNGCNYLGNDENPYLVLKKAITTDVENIVTHDDTKIIYNRAFYDCKKLTSVSMSDKIVQIGKDSFYGCDFESFTIPAHIKTIHSYSFNGCYINRLTIEEGVERIEDYACLSASYTNIPESVTYLGTDAIGGEIVRIGSGVSEIKTGNYGTLSFTFTNSIKKVESDVIPCDTKLLIIIFKGTMDEFKAIENIDNLIQKSETNKVIIPVACDDGDLIITNVDGVYAVD